MTQALRGPEAVKAALVEAATDLFASQGDASVRTVAARAGVNHGLVHHYFGGKSGLRAAVLERLAAGLFAALDVPADGSIRALSRAALRVTEQDPRMAKILARALLDGEVPRQLQSSFPIVERLLSASTSAGTLAHKAVIAEGLALTLGSLVFGEWIEAALGLDAQELEAIREQAIERNLDRLDSTGDREQSS